MNHFIGNLTNCFDSKLADLDVEIEDIIKKSKSSVEFINITLFDLKSYISEYNFLCKSEEITFFRTIKPHFLSKLIYFSEINQIECSKPLGRYESQICHYEKHLDKLNEFFCENIEFFNYIRSGSTHLDEIYFLRGNIFCSIYPDNFSVLADSSFSTSHDLILSKILAYNTLEKYLKTEIEHIKFKSNANKFSNAISSNTNIIWTDKKSALIELIYAIHTVGSVNNGNAGIREITECFEQCFNIKLIDVYRTFTDMKDRKAHTKYIDSLKSALTHKIRENI